MLETYVDYLRFLNGALALLTLALYVFHVVDVWRLRSRGSHVLMGGLGLLIAASCFNATEHFLYRSHPTFAAPLTTMALMLSAVGLWWIRDERADYRHPGT